MFNKGIDLSKLEKHGKFYLYRGKKLEANKPVRSTSKNKKMMVLATKKIGGKLRGKLIHFGSKGRKNNSKQAKENYLQISAGIRDKNGKLTKDDCWSANYWSRKFLWNNNQKPSSSYQRNRSRSRRAA